MEIRKAENKILLDQVHDLYRSAFPECERKPFALLTKKQAEGNVEILALEEKGEFSGLAITAKDADKVLLDYFAVAEGKRGRGAGSRALKALSEYYSGMRLILEIESTGTDVPDHEMRVRRKEFYHRNHMTDLPFIVDFFGTEMETLSNGTPFTYEEYWDIYKNAFGPEIASRIKFVKYREQKQEKTAF